MNAKIQLLNYITPKRVQAIIIFVILSCFLSPKLTAQYSLIDSVYFIPSHPVSSIETKVVLHSWFSNTPGELDSFQLETPIDTISLTSYFSVGGFQSFSNSLDTFNLGFLNIGSYTLKIKSQATYFIQGDTNDSIFVNFNVGTLNIDNNNSMTTFNLFPNPAKDKLNFSIAMDQNQLKISIFDMAGKKMQDYNYYSSEAEGNIFEESIDISSLSEGLYLCKFSFDGKQILRKFIKQ